MPATNVVGMEVGLPHERGEMGVIDRVIRSLSGPLGTDDPAIAQQAKLVRYARLGDADGDRDVADAQPACREGQDDLFSGAEHVPPPIELRAAKPWVPTDRLSREFEAGRLLPHRPSSRRL